MMIIYYQTSIIGNTLAVFKLRLIWSRDGITGHYIRVPQIAPAVVRRIIDKVSRPNDLPYRPEELLAVLRAGHPALDVHRGPRGDAVHADEAVAGVRGAHGALGNGGSGRPADRVTGAQELILRGLRHQQAGLGGVFISEEVTANSFGE